MISCRRVAEWLMADRLATENRWKRMEVRLHLAMCGACSRLARQIGQIGAGARRTREGNEADAGFEDRLLGRLQKR
jgi:hypothetical protein